MQSLTWGSRGWGSDLYVCLWDARAHSVITDLFRGHDLDGSLVAYATGGTRTVPSL